MPAAAHDTFVPPTWLAEHLGSPSIVAVDASFYLPDEKKDADALFRDAHIPGAIRFDVDAIADRSINLPHMLPDGTTFAAMVGALGVRDTDTVVIYDATDLLGGARAWWMFTHYGAKDVRVLEGGFRAWLAGNLPVERGPPRRPAVEFHAAAANRSIVDADAVLAASKSGSSQIVDARAASRFAGAVPEPRPGLRAGHIPGSLNVPWRDIVDSAGRLRPPAEIAAAFRAAGVDLDRPIITTCGSGVSAAVLLLGLEQLGKRDGSLYDGSWSEWGARSELPIETGAAKTGVAKTGVVKTGASTF